MSSTQPDPRRTARLRKVFKDVTKGGRTITTAADARLFLEAVRTNPTATESLELATASDAAQNALRHSLRIDLSLDFTRSHVLPFIDYLSDPGVKIIYNGQILHQVLALIVQPPTLWNHLVQAYTASQLDEDDLRVFAWLCLELASVPSKEHDGIIPDISSALQQKPFQEAQDHTTRDLMYRIKSVLALRSSPSPHNDTDTAGGRHDNDFADFRDISIFPTSDEFYSSAPPFFRRADEAAAVDPSERPRVHLDNQFRLLREDMLGELREDLTVAIGKKKGRRAVPQILGGLVPVGIDTGDESRGRCCSVLVSCQSGLESLERTPPPQRKAFLNNHRAFLRHQSFGALCGDNNIVAFASLIRDVASLAKSPPVVTLQFTSSEALGSALLALQSPTQHRFVLVDTPIFAYQPVLERLQEITEMPLEKDILCLSPDDADSTESTELNQSAQVQNYVRQFEQILAGASSTFSMGTKQFQLDKSQTRSVLSALQSPLSLIQGPPGTGKSFVGALAAKILLRDPSKRILVLAYTNHALDQFLEDLMNIGISSDTMVRLGSKFTEATEKLLLERQLRGTWGRAPWKLIERAKSTASEARNQIDDACGTLMRGKIDKLEILEYLEFSEDEQDFYDAFALPEQEDDFQFVGKSRKSQNAMSPDYLLDRWARGQDAGKLGQLIPKHARRIWQLPPNSRNAHMNTWIEHLRKEQIDTVQRLAKQFDDAQRQVDTLFNEPKCGLVRTKRLIGCTTTAAAMYKSLIKAASPDVVLVEEAGEILEAHVLTALHSATKQVILIGDHKQLRPKINNYTLSVEKGEGFDLNRSLFERLILEEHEHTTLQKQHRMHPDISDLIRRMTYPQLEDDKKTLMRSEPKGLQGRVSFINHSHPEDMADGITERHDGGPTSSKRNHFEAQMVLKLVRYLAQQGYTTSNVVVLTPYIGQLHLLKNLLSEETDPVLNDMDSFELIRAGLLTSAAAKVKPGSGQIKLSTIDNYQGEESDIVIASMTRSNNRGDIGFMKAPERLNVLCSRARECLIMIGNMETFMASSQGKPVWLPFFEILKEKGYLYDGVPIRCQQHPERTALLKDPDDFDKKCPDGGCDEKCDALLSCGKHRCQLRCHRIKDHAKVACQERIKKTCDRGHEHSIRCTDKEDACPACIKEDEDNRRRIQRDLKMEKERLLAQQRYAKELQVMEDELDHERRKLQYAQEDEDQKKRLEQARSDLRALRETTSRAEAMKAAANASKASQNAAAEKTSSQPPSQAITPDSAQEEWEQMKAQFGANSSALDNLMGMIGLESVKQDFLSIKSKVDAAVRQGISLADERFGCTLLGNPGTGKTTVARIYGQFLTSVGVIAGQAFKETSGAKLANMGVAGCEKMLDDVLNNGGGVVFIDEAYQLSSGNSPGGKAVLDLLLSEVENLTGKVVFVLAGYSKQMESFFAHNPGFPSRFPLEMKFGDYEDAELLQILTLQINKKYGGRMKWEDDLYLRVATRRLGRGRGKEGFGNARAVENLLARISGRQANRQRKERRKGIHSDELLFTKEDLVGPEPSSALGKSKAWTKLLDLIGLTSVKDSVKALVDSLQTNYHRELAEEPILEYTLNKVFLGSPGTGKTTIAQLYGEILVDIGMLSNGEVIVKNPADFTGAVIGASEALTKGILAATVGKVLVIDEAYGLFSTSVSTPCPFKAAVVDTIVAEVQSVPGEDRCVLLLGYKDQMEKMFQNVNPGLSRRFPMSSAFTFEDFTSAELRKILDMKLKQQGFKATDQAKKVAMEMLERARNRPNFGNAGEVDILLNEAKARHQTRLSSKETHQLSTLEALDFDENFDRAERTDTNVAKLFESTIGCELIVAKLEGYQETVRSMRALGMNPKDTIPFSFLFRGPPGTGKTTTARKMGKVFYDMGFLANAEVLECSTTDLIGSYVGHTGPKVRQLLDKALGRVLFVDEAYRLAGVGGVFAKEAVDELVDCVTKDRYKNRMVIILAGYDDEINRMLAINPGMSSRFPEAIDFHALSKEDCFDLLVKLLSKRKRMLESEKPTNSMLVSSLEQPASGFKEDVLDRFNRFSKQAGWANARDVERLAKSIFNAALRARTGTCITVTEAIVLAEMEKMFGELEARDKQTKTTSRHRRVDTPPPAPEMPPPPKPPAPTATGTGTQQQTRLPDRTKDNGTRPESAVHNGKNNGARGANRDAGVSDEVWEQLELDKKAQEERDERYRAMLKAQKEAAGAARVTILKQILEEEERRKQEEQQRKKAAEIGKCPAGFAWIKQAQGFRCAGGSHFISDDQISKA